MKRINPKVYLWASPLFCIDPERSHYHYQFIKNDNKRNYIFSAFKFFLRSSLSGLKKIFNKKIDGTRFIDKEDSNFVIYSPKVFLDLINNKCSYFPNAPKNISYFISVIFLLPFFLTKARIARYPVEKGFIPPTFLNRSLVTLN